MDELEIELRIRNNLLKRRRLSAGMSQAQLAKAIGVTVTAYGELESMHRPPLLKRSGRWRPCALKIAAYWKCEPEELWPEAIKRVNKTVARITWDAQQYFEAYQPKALPAPDEPDLRPVLNEAVSVLQPREQRIIAGLYRDGKQLEEVAQDMGVSRERIRQIEAKALRRLRHPSVADKIKQVIDIS
jgi:transcriptional regulator with XRE-family HTH domain